MLGKWLNNDPFKALLIGNLSLYVQNAPNNYYDMLGLVSIIVKPFKDDTDLGYYDRDKKRYIPDDEVRKGKTGNNDIHGFGGYYAYSSTSKCCCKNNQEGTVKLVQLINKDGKKFLVDINNDDLHDKRRRGFIEDNRVVGYIEEGGRSYPRYPGGYIDAPGLMKDEKKNKLKKSWLSYSAHILIEAYCKCDSRDEYLGQSVLLYVQRKKFHKNLDIFIIRNGEAPSQYPKYVEEIRKDYFFDR